MGKGNKEIEHWSYLIETAPDISKYDTRFGLRLGTGFHLRISDDGILEVWLKADTVVFHIQLVVPRTTGTKQVEIDAKYFSKLDGGGWNSSNSGANKLTTWKPNTYTDAGVSDMRGISADEFIDRSKEGFILWPNQLQFWNGDSPTLNLVESPGNPAHNFPMSLDKEIHEGTVTALYEEAEKEMPDEWYSVDVIRIEPKEGGAEPEPEPDVPARVAVEDYNMPQKKQVSKPRLQAGLGAR